MNSIAADFEDGVLLIVLLEVLSHKCLGTYFKKPLVIAQKVDNLEIAFNFIHKEGIRQEDIGQPNNYKLCIDGNYNECMYGVLSRDCCLEGKLIPCACARKMFGCPHPHFSKLHPIN